MTTYEISLRSPDADEPGEDHPAARPIRVSAAYIDSEQGLSPSQKAAIRALPPGGVWNGNIIQVKRLADQRPG